MKETSYKTIEEILKILNRLFHLPLTDRQILMGMMLSLAAAAALGIVYVLYNRAERTAKNEMLWPTIQSMIDIALYYNFLCLFAWLLALKELIQQITAAAFTAILWTFGVFILLDKLLDFIAVKRRLSKKAE